MTASFSSRLIRDPAVYGGQHARAQIAQVAPPPTPFHRSPFSILGEDAANYTRALTGVPFSDSTQSGNALARERSMPLCSCFINPLPPTPAAARPYCPF